MQGSHQQYPSQLAAALRDFEVCEEKGLLDELCQTIIRDFAQSKRSFSRQSYVPQASARVAYMSPQCASCGKLGSILTTVGCIYVMAQPEISVRNCDMSRWHPRPHQYRLRVR